MLTRLLAITCLTFTLLSTAHAYQAPAYFGIDGHMCYIPFDKKCGGNITPKNVPGVNLFVGFNANQYLSIEAGYQYSRSTRTVTLNKGDWVAGFIAPPIITPVTFKSSLVLQGPSINLFLTTPCLKEVPLQFFWGIGVSQLKATVSRRTMQFGEHVGVNTRVLENCRVVGRVTAFGANYFVTPDIAVRASVSLSNTKKLRRFICDSHYPFIKQEMRAKNSVAYSIGVRWNF